MPLCVVAVRRSPIPLSVPGCLMFLSFQFSEREARGSSHGKLCCGLLQQQHPHRGPRHCPPHTSAESPAQPQQQRGVARGRTHTLTRVLVTLITVKTRDERAGFRAPAAKWWMSGTRSPPRTAPSCLRAGAKSASFLARCSREAAASTSCFPRGALRCCATRLHMAQPP